MELHHTFVTRSHSKDTLLFEFFLGSHVSVSVNNSGPELLKDLLERIEGIGENDFYFWYTTKITDSENKIDIWPSLKEVPDEVVEHAMSHYLVGLAHEIDSYLCRMRYAQKSMKPRKVLHIYEPLLNEIINDDRINNEVILDFINADGKYYVSDEIQEFVNKSRLSILINRILTLHFKNFIEPIGCKSDLQTGIPESGFPAI